MKKYSLLATVLIALASCTSDEFVGDQELGKANDNAPVTFNFDVPAITRADNEGPDAAAKLNNQFIVYGEKNETSASALADGNLVFQNYQVNYAANSAYTTTSNTKDWEYVGYTHSTEYAGNISPSANEVQTIKYWDYGASNYVFTAVSANPYDITNGLVKITKTTSSGNSVYDKGYVVTLTKGSDNTYPSLANLYFSDRNVIEKTAGNDRTAKNAYGGNATMKFRNSLSQVRVGMYETVPGYDITAISFKVTGDAIAKQGNAEAFGAICPNVSASNFEGSITVTYYDATNTDIENRPKLTITAGNGLSNTDLILGTNINAITTDNPLATTSAAPTFDTDGGTYTAVLPQITNAETLKLKVNYTLYNSVTKETITVENATTEIPAAYVAWKPNFKYTYLFKISDNSNGYTGGDDDPAGLYPITFDAVEVVAEDGQAEYITTVSEPSITTFGVKDGKYVSGGSEYTAGSDIYVTIVAGGSVVTPVEGDGAGKVNYYTVDYKSGATDAEKAAYPITEASVAEAIAEAANVPTGGTPMIVCTKNNDLGEPVTKVPGEDGVEIDQNAVKMAGLAAGTYAVEYTPQTGNKVYKVIVVQ